MTAVGDPVEKTFAIVSDLVHPHHILSKFRYYCSHVLGHYVYDVDWEYLPVVPGQKQIYRMRVTGTLGAAEKPRMPPARPSHSPPPLQRNGVRR